MTLTLEDVAVEVVGRRNIERNADTLLVLAIKQTECLRWISSHKIGGRGGIPEHVIAKCASLAANGLDWKAHRDAERAKQKPLRGQLPRG